MSFRQFSAPIVKVGDNVVWVNNSSWHAHQHKIIFHVETIKRDDKLMTDIEPHAYALYAMTGTKMYEQTEGKWHQASGPVAVTYYYADTLGQGFPSVIQQDVEEYVKIQQEPLTRK